MTKHETEPDIPVSAPVDSDRQRPTSYQIFASALVAALGAKPGSGAEAASRTFARRMAHEIYLEDCRAAVVRRNKWLALLGAQASGSTSEREGS